MTTKTPAEIQADRRAAAIEYAPQCQGRVLNELASYQSGKEVTFPLWLCEVSPFGSITTEVEDVVAETLRASGWHVTLSSEADSVGRRTFIVRDETTIAGPQEVLAKRAAVVAEKAVFWIEALRARLGRFSGTAIELGIIEDSEVGIISRDIALLIQRQLTAAHWVVDLRSNCDALSQSVCIMGPAAQT